MAPPSSSAPATAVASTSSRSGLAGKRLAEARERGIASGASAVTTTARIGRHRRRARAVDARRSELGILRGGSRARAPESSAPGSMPELVHERRAGGAERLERVGLAAAAVQGEHLQCAQPLAQRVLGDQRVELGGRLGLAPALEVRARSGARAPRAAARRVARRSGAAPAAPARSDSAGPRHSASAADLVAAASRAPSAALGHARCRLALEALQVQRAVGTTTT